VVVVGAGPAGLLAADVISAAGRRVLLVDRMPSPGRKLLMAGRGGLNLTHSEDLDAFLGRYGAAGARLAPLIREFPPSALIQFAEALGQATFVGSSGRVFPKAMKASPLLRAWLARLATQGVQLTTGRRLVEVDEDLTCRFITAAGASEPHAAGAVVLALGGGSWARLGSDGGWVDMLRGWGVATEPLAPANCGVTIDWSEHVRSRFAGTPLKRIAVSTGGQTVRGEAMITANGLEGGAVYAVSPLIRAALAAHGHATLTLDLRPDLELAGVTARLAAPRGKMSAANWLRKTLALSPAAIALLHENAGKGLAMDPDRLAARIKAVPLRVTGLAGLERAISTSGGVAWDEVDSRLMLRRRPGIFLAGEMLDWEAPTGGYLLQACFATGRAAGLGVLAHLEGQPCPAPPIAGIAG
jgi:uncharacterized flavoprotein (TIGR03862 family)